MITFHKVPHTKPQYSIRENGIRIGTISKRPSGWSVSVDHVRRQASSLDTAKGTALDIVRSTK